MRESCTTGRGTPQYSLQHHLANLRTEHATPSPRFTDTETPYTTIRYCNLSVYSITGLIAVSETASECEVSARGSGVAAQIPRSRYRSDTVRIVSPSAPSISQTNKPFDHSAFACFHPKKSRMLILHTLVRTKLRNAPSILTPVHPLHRLKPWPETALQRFISATFRRPDSPTPALAQPFAHSESRNTRARRFVGAA